MQNAGEATPLDALPPVRLFGGLSDEQWLWLNVEGRAKCSFLANYLPAPGDAHAPATNAVAGNEALVWGFRHYAQFKEVYERHRGPFTPDLRVLDFGCGWGRLARYFLRDLEPENLIGVDVDPAAVAAARNTNPWFRFEESEIFPPTRFESQTFDLVYAWSVFSHLSEESHLAWLAEFVRVTKPGGLVLLTTLGRGFLAEELPAVAVADEIAPWQQQALSGFGELEPWVAAFDRGEFCYSAIPGTPHFGFTCIPEAYIRNRWAEFLQIEEIVPTGTAQVMIVARRP